jgi:glyoxylase-like metal-dependent hydrolase (beta-lactamase superfamily II)
MQIDWVPVTRAEQNCAILWCEKTRKAAVIDPGGDIYRVLDYLEWENLTLELILITHGHPDHAGGAAALAEVTGARIEGPHRAEAEIIQTMPEVGARFGLPHCRVYTPHRWLEDGDQVHFGEQVIDVAHCPGHTPGHVAYFHEPSRFAFVGDILFLNAIGNWSHGYGSLGQLVDSICTKLFPLGDDVQFLPGHGDTSTFGHERIKNPFVGQEALERWRSGDRKPPRMPSSSNPLGAAQLGF